MKACPFCGFDNAWVRPSPWDIIEDRKDQKNYVIQCNTCHSMGPESQTQEGAEEKWNGILREMDPNDKEIFQEKLEESQNFNRDLDPLRKMGLGQVKLLLDKTQDAFSFDRYGDSAWSDIIVYLANLEYNADEIEMVLRSKLMRWASDRQDQNGKSNLDLFKKYNEYKYDWENNKYDPLPFEKFQTEEFLESRNKSSFNEEAMGGVSTPGATLNNTPGMGNAQPASTAGLNVGDSTGSGDNWGDASIGKIATQKAANEGDHPIFMPLLNENNINPHDKLGVAMAKKMGAALPFKKGKGDKDVEQTTIDEDIDLSSEITSFDVWAKDFLNQ